MTNRYKAVQIGKDWYLKADGDRHDQMLFFKDEVACKKIAEKMNKKADEYNAGFAEKNS